MNDRVSMHFREFKIKGMIYDFLWSSGKLNALHIFLIPLDYWGLRLRILEEGPNSDELEELLVNISMLYMPK